VLNLPQSLFLLALDDYSGKLIPGTSLRFGLIGAVLVELALNGKVGLASGSKLQVLDSSPTGDEILDAELTRITKLAQPQKISSWVNSLGQKKLRKRITETLVAMDVLERDGTQYRGVIPNGIFPHENGSAKYWVKQNLRGIVLAAEPSEPRMLALLNLLHACQLLGLVFTKDERKEASRQLEKLTQLEPSNTNGAKTVEEIKAAVTKAVLSTSAGK
jgi:hypothetical protein